MQRLVLASVFSFVITLATAATLDARALDPTQPAPVKARPGHGVALCPSPAGLQGFAVETKMRATRAAASYGRKSLATDLRNADRAWWSHIRTLWRSSATARAHDVVLGSEPAATSGFSVFLRPACGASTVSHSLMVTVGPSQSGSGPHCDACNVHLFYVSRDKRPLLWFVY